MARQLIYTSAEHGLAAGRSGFCTVARHADLRERLVAELERFSAFDRPTAGPLPVIRCHRILTIGSDRYHVLSCIQDAGPDYSGRTNHIAHHLICEESELSAAPSPALVLLRFPWRSRWNEPARLFERSEEVDLAQYGAPALPDGAWQALTGNPGHALLLVGSKARQGCYVAYSNGDEADLVELFDESLGKLTFKQAEKKWQIPFTTFLQPTDNARDFGWRGCWANSATHREAEASEKAGGDPVFDLTQPNTLPALKTDEPVRSAPVATVRPPAKVSVVSVTPNRKRSGWKRVFSSYDGLSEEEIRQQLESQLPPEVRLAQARRRQRRIWIITGSAIAAVAAFSAAVFSYIQGKPVDKSPPLSSPNFFQAKWTESNQVDLFWSPVEEVKDYLIIQYLRGETGRSNHIFKAKITNAVLYLEVGKSYDFQIRSINSNNETSPPENSKTITIHTPPGTPKELTAQRQQSNSIVLTWAPVSNTTSYVVWCGENEVGTPTTNTFTHSNLSPGSNYCYQVEAANKAGRSLKSKSECAETPNLPREMEKQKPSEATPPSIVKKNELDQLPDRATYFGTSDTDSIDVSHIPGMAQTRACQFTLEKGLFAVFPTFHTGRTNSWSDDAARKLREGTVTRFTLSEDARTLTRDSGADYSVAAMHFVQTNSFNLLLRWKAEGQEPRLWFTPVILPKTYLPFISGEYGITEELQHRLKQFRPLGSNQVIVFRLQANWTTKTNLANYLRLPAYTNTLNSVADFNVRFSPQATETAIKNAIKDQKDAKAKAEEKANQDARQNSLFMTAWNNHGPSMLKKAGLPEEKWAFTEKFALATDKIPTWADYCIYLQDVLTFLREQRFKDAQLTGDRWGKLCTALEKSGKASNFEQAAQFMSDAQLELKKIAESNELGGTVRSQVESFVNEWAGKINRASIQGLFTRLGEGNSQILSKNYSKNIEYLEGLLKELPTTSHEIGSIWLEIEYENTKSKLIEFKDP